MKKSIALFLAFILTLLLVACSTQGTQNTSDGEYRITMPSNQRSDADAPSQQTNSESEDIPGQSGAISLEDFQHGDLVCLTFENIFPDEHSSLLDEGVLLRTQINEGADNVFLVIKGNLTGAPHWQQSINVEDVSITLNGVTKLINPYTRTKIEPMYYERADITIFPVFQWVWGDAEFFADYDGFGDDGITFVEQQSGVFSAELVLNGVNVASDTYTVTEGLIEVSEDVQVPRLNTSDLSYYGNSHGNAAYRGLAAEKDGWIYYTNGGDGGSLYKERLDGSEKTQLTSEPSDSINVVNDWVYYRNYDEGFLYKIRTDGTERMLVCEDKIKDALVVGGWIYYANADDGLNLYRIRTDGTGRICLTFGAGDFKGINIVANTILAGTVPHPMDLSRGSSTATNGVSQAIRDFELYSSLWTTYAIDGDWAYGADDTGNGAIFKHDYSGNGYTAVNDEPSGFVNPVGEWVYYSNLAENGALYKIRTDGTERTKLTDDNSENINVVGEWIYYENMSDGGRIYRIRTDGTAGQAVA